MIDIFFQPNLTRRRKKWTNVLSLLTDTNSHVSPIPKAAAATFQPTLKQTIEITKSV